MTERFAAPPLASPLRWTSGDPAAAALVLQATARSVLERGHPELWPHETLTVAALAQDYPAEGWHIAWQGEQPVGCFVLMDPDPVFWAEKPAGEALYLHKLAVHPLAQGQELNRALLARAEQLTREADRRWLRLDTDVTRPKLQAIYTGFGFTAVDRQQVMGFEVFRYQKEV
ncbi:GCN5-related N-acetyltransferase [Deinococcus proteolyticus MRP]|uniref:GCN5-related N-acetyltransferase n=1 Tax=Deinococcus proteolyticus (strain ATCC 35074 / DSM 20540 / JCM 6276 / NBRC 101906 / NCIMB 13154 / VKM Ac-1939 / CCM 2703 / MRP) TaxID=693977 RepID=F0RLQ3_DEIPM|nr:MULTISPECIES: GNAT family N-acetyltransferase [Deinococcus]ADY25892.1 GCN5-related N-acetyltransferase [Deinococcus proteolyticus MRP]MCY1702014.1 GNAT family N-acetyltransferase [Deinococcus sp. SL84]